MFKFCWNIVAALAVLASIYQGYSAWKAPVADLELVTSTSNFELPKIPEPFFDSIEQQNKLVFENYSYIADNSQLKTITYSGLYNYGDKIASDIRLSFPNAQIISVRLNGDEIKNIRGRSTVDIDKLLPNSNIYFVVWGAQRDSNSNIDSISGAYSDGVIKVSSLVTVPEKWLFIVKYWDVILSALVILACLVFMIYAYYEYRSENA